MLAVLEDFEALARVVVTAVFGYLEALARVVSYGVTFALVRCALVREVSRLEAAGGVDRAEREIDAELIAATHARYAAERDAAIPPGHTGPRPYGGVGGTRIGVKCLHAHVAHLLATGDDVVGTWTLEQIRGKPT